MSRSARDAVAFHVAFAVVAVAVLFVPPGAGPEAVAASGGVPLGWRLLALVVLYNVALPLVGRARGHAEWASLWLAMALISVWQVVPDAFLVEVLGTLRFPDTGGPRLGGVPLAMAGMWTIPLWIAVFASRQVAGADVLRGALLAAAFAGVILVSSEATLWALPIWEAVGVRSLGPVALYVIVPEVVLGATAYLAYVLTRERPLILRMLAGSAVALIYLGGLAASYLVVDGRPV
ncbi:MAG: hypothetical protein AAF845_13425 [Bacteroidota bacterium]